MQVDRTSHQGGREDGRGPLDLLAGEYAGTSALPCVAQVLALFAAVALVLISLLGGPQATADSGQQVGHRDAPTSTVPACARHFPPTCQQPARGR